MIHTSVSFEYEPALEPLHMSAKKQSNIIPPSSERSAILPVQMLDLGSIALFKETHLGPHKGTSLIRNFKHPRTTIGP